MNDPVDILRSRADAGLTDEDVRSAWPLAAMAAHATRPFRHGRPVRLTVRLIATVAVASLAVTAVGWQPASVAIITGAVTWLLLTGRADLAPGRPGRCNGSRSRRLTRRRQRARAITSHAKI